MVVEHGGVKGAIRYESHPLIPEALNKELLDAFREKAVIQGDDNEESTPVDQPQTNPSPDTSR